jgi:predicted nucleic acid-binding protein
MIVADTGAVLALLDKTDKHHQALVTLFDEQPGAWVLPWAVLPEVDYLVGAHIGAKAQDAWLDDLRTGAFQVEWGSSRDLVRAAEISRAYRSLRLGLVDSVVIAIAERLKARTIATLDLRHFGAVRIAGGPRLVPRDLP